MILVTFFLGIVTGLAGHRTSDIFDYMEKQGTPRTWWLTGRYGVGVLIGMFVFFVSIFKKPWRDEATMKAGAAFVFVGIGTICGYVLDELMEGKK